MDEGCQISPKPVLISTSVMQKWPLELTVSPQETAAKKQRKKRPRASTKKEEWMEVRHKKNFQKPKPQAMKPVKASLALCEVVGQSG